jgi:hypothetical protein
MSPENRELNRKKLIFVSWCLTFPLTLFAFVSINGLAKGIGLAMIFSVPIAVLTIILIIFWIATFGILYAVIIMTIVEGIVIFYKWLKPKGLSLWNWLHR